MIRKSIKKKVVSAIFSLVIMVILLHGFTVSVAAAPVSGTLLFTGPEGVTNIGLMAHDNILINNVSGTDIPNIELDIYGALNESNATNGIRDGSVVYYYDAVNGFTGIGPIDVESGDVTQVDANIPRYFIIKSHNGAEFSFQSIDVYDYIAGNSPIKFEGFRDGISTGSNILQIISSKETFTLGNQLNQSVFQNVDEIRITNQNEGDMTWGIYAVINNIKINDPVVPQATPSFSPVAGAIAFGSTVTITSTGAEHIYYTTDGTDPGTLVGGSTLEYIAPITVNSAMTIKAIATRTNYVNSVIGSASYTQDASADLANIALSGTPSNFTFTGASDTYNGVTVGNGVDSITVTPSGAGTITVEGITVNSGEASASINLTPGVEKIITVVVTETGKTAKTYTIKVTRQMATQATPSFSPAAGAIAFGSTVTITSTGAEHIYYTTDGTDPGTAVGGSTLEYAAPITVNSAMTIKAIATRTNYVNSVIGSASYTQAASADLANIALSGTPSNYTFTGASDTYTGVTVGNGVDSITVTPSGAGTITVDAVTVNSGEASASINLTPGVEKIITVVVTETGKTAKTYTIKVTRQMATQATPSFSPAAGTIAFGSTVTITSTGAEHIYYTTDGTDPGTAVGGSTLEYAAPITVNSAMTIKAIATRTNYVNSVIGSASYTQAASADLANIALSGTPSNYTFTGASDTYTGVTVGNGVDSITVTPSGAGTITVDAVTVNSGEASASINLTPGVEKIITVVVTETGKTAKTYTIKVTRQMATQATPSFSPAAGTIAFGSTVTITSTGAEHIYYTTDGTDPGTVVGGSTLEYTAPVTVNSAMTIKAIATRTNYVNSVIGSASYTQAASADLTNIALSGTPSNYTFTGASDTYTGVTVGNGVDSITVTPSGAGTITVDAVTVNSGEASAPINLTPGVEKIITVVVTETGKTAKTYTIKVILSIPSYSNNNSIGDQDKKGLIIKEQLQDESVPNTNLNNTTDELKEAVFTTEELSKIKEGEDAKVILKVTDISNSVSEDDKKLIAKKLDGDVPPIMYIDLSLYKKVGNGTETKITETNKKISISIEVPVELRNTDLTKSRTYQIVRIHDGEVTVIKGTYDSIKGLFTFETDRFSTYALTFVDRNTGENENFVKIMKDFFHLRLTAKAAETSQILKYTNISGADGYIIYGAICGSNNKLVKLADVSGKITSYNHKGLKKSTYYKYQVQAYKIINDKKVIFAKSKVIHSVTISKNYDNPKKLISEVSDLTLAVGESKKVTCQVVLPVSKKMKQHTDIICYETSNKAIAIVSPNGKIKAISRGSCYIYAYAQNGVYKKINVTIK